MKKLHLLTIIALSTAFLQGSDGSQSIEGSSAYYTEEDVNEQMNEALRRLGIAMSEESAVDRRAHRTPEQKDAYLRSKEEKSGFKKETPGII